MKFINKLNNLLTILRNLDLEYNNDILVHSMGAHAPCVESLIVPDIEPTSRDIVIAKRLLSAYQLSIEADKTTQYEDLWSSIKKQQPTFLEALHRGDPDLLATYLCNMSRHDATIGTIQGNVEYQRFHHDAKYRDFVARMIKDKLVLLAEAIGAVPTENPEQGRWGENFHINVDFLVEQIERILGMDVMPPPVDGGLLKIRTSRGLFHERDFNAIYTAWFLRSILQSIPSASICEIGAGTGRVAYWSWRFGFRTYTIFDLPHINVVSGFYLLKSLPDASITLFGEKEVGGGTGRINIQPAYMIHSDISGRYDLVLNQDSFPEINAETVRGYLERIKALSSKYFLSINHESRPPSGGNDLQLNVQEIIASVRGYRRQFRVPYWLRRGYTAELYVLNASDDEGNFVPAFWE